MTLRGKTDALFKLGLIALAIVYFSIFLSSNASAAQITSRSLTLEQGAGGDGGSKPGGTVKHKFDFTIPSSTTLGSIKFQYCTTASGTCSPVSGLTTTGSVTLSNQSGLTGFSLDNTTNGSPFIHRTAAAPGGANTAVSYELSGVVNPSTTNQTFYVRITTYSSEDVTTGATDTGTVAASTATQITLTGTMPESLIFCTGGAISLTSGIPDCSTATSGSITFNQLFSPADTAVAKSQMAASTNADFGYSITYTGATLTSGSNTVTAMTSATTSVRGTRQFGMNLTLNDGTAYTNAPNVTGSANIAPTSNGTNYRGQALTGYDTAGTFKFNAAGDSIANSANGGAGPTDVQLYTASYIANVSGGQPIGTYTTTLTYICTATF
jgi:hypothetical protein